MIGISPTPNPLLASLVYSLNRFPFRLCSAVCCRPTCRLSSAEPTLELPPARFERIQLDLIVVPFIGKGCASFAFSSWARNDFCGHQGVIHCNASAAAACSVPPPDVGVAAPNLRARRPIFLNGNNLLAAASPQQSHGAV